jgi:hypothetical protein
MCSPVDYGSWSPALAYGLLGFWLVALGMLGMRERTAKPAAVTTVVVEPPAPPAPPATPAPPAAEESPAPAEPPAGAEPPAE